MSVPAGYKATEVGVIPVDWEVSTVGEQFHIQLGKMLDAERNRGLPKPYVGNRAVRWGRIDTAELDTVPMSASDMSRYRLKTGDILVCEGGEVGRSAIWNGELPECYYQKALHRLRAKGAYNSELLIEVLYQASINGGFTNFVSQTSIAHLTKEKFATFPIPKPNEAEQSAIAEALSDVDAAIAAQEAVIAKKRALKTATMQALLSGTRRLPGFGDTAASRRMKHSEVGVIPEEWEVAPLSQTARRITRGASPRPIDDPVWFDEFSSVGWVRISDVTRSGRYLRETTQRLSEAGIRRSRPVPAGSLIMSICATVGRPIETKINTCIHDGFVVFDQPTVDQSFLYHMLAAIEPKWSKQGQTGSQMNLNTGLINACVIALPTSKIEQSAIAEILSDIDEEISEHESKLTKLRQLKTGMMQQLLTGKIRLI